MSTTSKSKPAEASDPEIDVVIDLADLEDEDALELTDDDFVLLDTAAPPPPISRPVVGAALLTSPSPSPSPSSSSPASERPISQARLDTLRTKTLRAGLHSEPPPPPLSSTGPEVVREARRSFSRLTLDEDAESSVADECLATIAAATSHARALDPIPIAVSSARSLRPRDDVDVLLADVSSLGKLPPPSVPPRTSSTATIPPPSSSAGVALAPRLPPVSPPPFVRGSVPPPARISVPGVAPMVSEDNDAAETLPFPMRTPFARTETDDERASRPSLPRLAPSAPLVSNVCSVAPVSLPRHDATNVTVVVRERPPRAGWVIAAAAIGALAAVMVMRVAAPTSPATVATATATTAPPPAAASAAAPAVVRFGEEEGVAIKVPAPATAAPAASHVVRVSPVAPRPVQAAPAHVARPSRPLNPKVAPPVPMPDGSLGFASSGTSGKTTGSASASAPAPAPTPLPLPPSGGRKRPLTPEQELAEAQLRAASMR